MKISIQTGRTKKEIGFEKTYRLFKETGFEAVDWNINDLLSGRLIYSGEFRGASVLEKPLDEMLKYLEPELREIRKNGLEITQAHAPFPAMSVAHPDSLDFSIEIYKNCIRLCDAVSCKNLIIHGVYHQRGDSKHTAKDIDNFNWKMFSSLIPVLKETNVTVCLENIFSMSQGPKGMVRILGDRFSNPDFTAEFIDKLNEEAGKDCFGFCLDTGHLNLLHIDERVYIPTLGKRIKALHIHDNDGIDDRHVAPYNGNIPWDSYMKELKNAGYEGDISFETASQTSLEYITEEMLPIQLKSIYVTGEHFRNLILDK